MATDFRILTRRRLLVVRHSGHLTFADSMESFEDYGRHPDFHPAQNALVDFAPVTSYEHDRVRLMAFQAQMIERLPLPAGTPPLLVFVAPRGRPAHPLACDILKSWDKTGLRTARLAETEAEALDILGLPERSIEALLAVAT